MKKLITTLTITYYWSQLPSQTRFTMLPRMEILLVSKRN